LFVDECLSLGLGFLNAAVTLGSFVGILWSISGPLEIPLGGATYVIYGYMVWVAIAYAIVGTWLTHKIGKPLIPLNFNQQRYEADFRFNLVRFRENSEGVALYRGEEDELRGFRSRLFTRIVPTIREIGLWGPKIRAAYEDMGIIGFADVDSEALSRQDEQVAEEMDRLRGR